LRKEKKSMIELENETDAAKDNSSEDFGEETATCPACGHTGPEAQDFSWLAAGFNGIKPGDPDDLDLLECGECEHRFDPNEVVEPDSFPAGPAWASDETVASLRSAANLLNAEADGRVFLPNWDGADGEQERLIRDGARAVLAREGSDSGAYTTKKALAALVHYVGDMLEE
jgi:hypothetical protein